MNLDYRTRGKLNPRQKRFAGQSYSDHVALLNVFHTWEGLRHRGSMAEENFCENKSLALTALKLTWEASVSINSPSLHPYFL